MFVTNLGRWDKAYYYIGKHYNKLLESEKLLTPTKQSKILYVIRAYFVTIADI